ncbi:TetR/AcrR family transcriptional regulator [Nonomuraea bangladeshensis]|uniref:TetR/AcrR family transcriptional regulator n=1 Tax=Nonomuraea bangladeshensis TaxID=404385 RepID=A0ABV3H9V5_9ACTN
MTNETGRRRAPAMTPEQRREMIVRAALPLVVEHGTSVTTAQVARAAGIGEGTVFRAFGDKDALLDACMAEALRPDDTLAHIASVSMELPLAERLIEAAEAMRGYLSRMGAVAGALAASGGLRRGDPTAPAAREGESREEHLRRGADARQASIAAHQEVLAGLFEPERDTLKLPPDRLALAFQMLVLSAGRHNPDTLTTAELVDLFLHGALTTG